jgi:hypothetical protein
MGRKEPFDDDRRTDGICPACAEAQIRQEPGSNLELLHQTESWDDLLLEVKTVAQTIADRVEKALSQE